MFSPNARQHSVYALVPALAGFSDHLNGGLKMGVEAFFAAREGSVRRPLADYARMLINAGHRCLEEPDQWGRWLVFPGHESALNFSVEDGAAVFATFDISKADPPEFLSDIERLFAEAGWITGPAENR